MTRARDDRRESPFFPRISEGERSCEYRANLVSSLKRALQAWRFQLQMSHQLCTREPLSIQPSLRTEALECRHRYNHCMDGGSRQGPSIQPLYGRRLTPRPVHTTIVWTEAHAKARPRSPRKFRAFSRPSAGADRRLFGCSNLRIPGSWVQTCPEGLFSGNRFVDGHKRGAAMVRKHHVHWRFRSTRKRPKTPAPKQGWVIADLSTITGIPVRRIRYYVERDFIVTVQPATSRRGGSK